MPNRVRSADTFEKPRNKNLRATSCSLMIPKTWFDQRLSPFVRISGFVGGHPDNDDGAASSGPIVTLRPNSLDFVQTPKAGHA